MSWSESVGRLAVSVGAIVCVAPVSAQPTTVAYRLVGTVSAADGHAIGGADVSIVLRDSAVRSTRSDSAGHFAFEGLTLLALTVRVRYVGYNPQLLSVAVTKPGRTANIAVTLEPSVTTLSPVLVEDSAKHPRPNPRLIGFNERRATSTLGRFVTEEMLTALRPQHASEALRTVPGVTLRSTSIGNQVRFRDCGVGASRSRVTGVTPLVWLDGVRLPGAEIDDVVQAGDIAGIEVYNSVAGVPAQFFDRTAVCGTIVIWTKHR